MWLSALTANWATYALGSFWALNNVWGAGALVNGVDYTQSISIDRSTFPNGVTMSWSWPNGTAIFSYPEIVYGAQQSFAIPTRTDMPPPTQVAAFTNLSAQYSLSISGQTRKFDVAFDLWLTSRPDGGIEDELMVLVHDQWTPVPQAQNIGTVGSFRIYLAHNWGNSGQTWNLIQLKPATDTLAATISLSDILKTLVWNGVLTGSEYISGIELGAEVAGGSGSLTINSLGYRWEARPTIFGTDGNDIFNIAAAGGNYIIGKGGIDVVKYNGPHSQFQIKQLAGKALVMKNNDISTLDVLSGVTYVEFSDGKYDCTTSRFLPAAAR